MNKETIRQWEQFPARTFDKGEFIIRQGDSATHVFYLADGTCLRKMCIANGSEVEYGERQADGSASCLLGALALYQTQKINGTGFIAKTACTCHVIPSDDFLAYTSKNAELLQELLYLAVINYDELRANFHGKIKGLAPARIAQYLLGNAAKIDGKLLLAKPLNLSEIARELGLHRMTVSKIVGALCDAGCIAYSGKTLAVLNTNELNSYATGAKSLNYQKKSGVEGPLGRDLDD